MNVIAQVEVEAHEAVDILDRTDLDTTVITTGDRLPDGYVIGGPVQLYVRGPIANRADFLRRLAAAATAAAAELDAPAVTA